MELRTLGEQDRYVILGELGRGGMAVVHLAVDRKLGGRAVAIKQPFTTLAAFAPLLERFGQETDAMARAVHPNIVMLTDHAVEPSPYIVMEYVEGLSAAACVLGAKKGSPGFGPLPPRVACDIAIGILLALCKLGELGIVHRDIKPANVMVGWGGEVKIMDFGLARLMQDQLADATENDRAPGDRLTETGFMGSKEYASPEQCRDPRIADHRSDLYTVGSTVYSLFTALFPDALYNESLDSKTFGILPEAVRPVVFGATRYLAEDIAAMKESQPQFVVDETPRAYQSAAEMLVALRAARDALPSTGQEAFYAWLAERRAESVPEKMLREFRAPAAQGDVSPDRAKLEAGFTFWYHKAAAISPTPPPDLPAPEPVAAPPRRSPWLPRVAAGVFAAGMLALAGSEAWERMKPAAPDAPPVVVAEGKAEPVPALASNQLPPSAEPVPPEPVVADPPPVVVSTTPVTRPTPNTRPASRPEPTVIAPLAAPAIVAPPAPEPVPVPTGGTVRLTGDATTGELVGADNKSRGLTSVPPGTYTVRATFATKGTVNAGKVTVSEGMTATLTCVERLAVCSVR